MGQILLGQKYNRNYDTLPVQVSDFYSFIGDGEVYLSWVIPVDDNFAGVLIVRKTGGYPQRPSDGVRIYAGTSTSYIDAGLTNDTQYYYRAYAYNSKKQYQTLRCVTTMTPLQHYILGQMPIGTKVKFGSLFGSKIVHRIANIKDDDITLITDRLITKYALDWTSRYRYKDSCINQWLNSDAGAGKWYNGTPPNENSSGVNNLYYSAAGYLHDFSTREKAALKSTQIIARYHDGQNQMGSDAYDVFKTYVWIPNAAEMGYYTELNEGSRTYQVFANGESRDALSADGSGKYPYWVRTPSHTLNDEAYYILVGSTGNLKSMAPVSTTYGIRPCCCLDASTPVSVTVDSDGCYKILL